ncbi:MAG: phage tail length tape measure family protein [Planctomycetia bacterium]|nr:phage tail length tape measure family protein [Planctomycetia bacterium]
MATSIGDLVATLGINNLPFKSGLTGAQASLMSFASKTKATLGSVAGMFGVGIGVGGLVYAAKNAVAAYTEAEQAEKKLGAVIAATCGAAGLTKTEMISYASELQRVTNFEDDATIAAMGVLATFRQIKGDHFKEATAAAQDMSAVMGTDLQAAMLQVGKALNDPIAAMTALKRAGVSFTEAQKDQIEALQKSGDLMGAQGMILAELKNEFGGAARAMADPMIQLNNRMGDLNELIGQQLKPAIVEMMTSLTGGLE